MLRFFTANSVLIESASTLGSLRASTRQSTGKLAVKILTFSAVNPLVKTRAGFRNGSRNEFRDGFRNELLPQLLKNS